MTMFHGFWTTWVLMDLFDVILRSIIRIDHDILGPTCGLLPVGVDSALLTTTGLRWNLGGQLCISSGIPSLTWSLDKVGRNRLSMDWFQHPIIYSPKSRS